MLFSSFLAAIA
uniref:Uncharacterized protein n=1 Tax=Anguilla anguilla TaxID=7936 RepID=A0A0E9XXQ4_ANGAN